jgi:hypothetical protein
MRSTLIAAAVAAAALFSAAPAVANSQYRYQNAGTVNPLAYSFSALSDGDFTIYTMNGTGSYLSKLGVKVNGVTIAQGILPSGSDLFQPTTIGQVSAGDRIEFFIDTYHRDETNSYIDTFYSEAEHNPGNLQHIYASAFPGESWIGVPQGTFVAFEDTNPSDGLGDLNYNDYAFVIPNLTFSTTVAPPSAVPEPTTWAMMLIGFGATGGALRSRRRPTAYIA